MKKQPEVSGVVMKKGFLVCVGLLLIAASCCASSPKKQTGDQTSDY
jgi:hypothetical protein